MSEEKDRESICEANKQNTNTSLSATMAHQRQTLMTQVLSDLQHSISDLRCHVSPGFSSLRAGYGITQYGSILDDFVLYGLLISADILACVLPVHWKHTANSHLVLTTQPPEPVCS